MSKSSIPQGQPQTAAVMIAVADLEKSPLNVRRTVAKGASAELKASILAHGLMQNLVVTAAGKGKYHVIAGARRLEALKALQKEKKLPGDYAVPCQVADEAQATEMSLAENTVRHAMHPADEFEAYAALADNHSAEQIAQRFGVDEKHVLQRLKLGKVAPELLKEYRAGKLSLEALMAFTFTDDRKRQLSVYKSLQGWQKDNARHIRSCLTEQMIDADSSLAKFVGMKAYAKAGGNFRPDLFGDSEYWEDAEIVHRLAGEKLEAAAEKLRSEGWGWVEVAEERDYDLISSCSRIQAKPLNAPGDLVEQRAKFQAEYDEIDNQIDATDDDDALDTLWEQREAAQERLDELDEEMKQYLEFDPEHKKLAGCYVSINREGKVDIYRGLVRKQDQKKLLAASTDQDAGDAEPSDTTPKVPESLRRDLEFFRLQVAQVEIARNPEIAFDLAAFTLVHRVFDMYPVYTGAQISTSGTSIPGYIEELSPVATKEMKAIEASLPRKWHDHEEVADRFAAFRELTQPEKLKLLAYATANSLKAQLNVNPEDRDHFEDALSLTGGDVASYWRPTADNYFKRLKREQLLEIGREIFGDKWAEFHFKHKKGEVVAKLDADFANPAGISRYAALVITLREDAAERLKTWLPEGMAFQPSPEAAPTGKAKRKAA